MIEQLHNFLPDALAFSFGPIEVRWYGLFIVAGIVSALQISTRLAKRWGLNGEDIYDAGFWAIVSGIIGARIYHILLELPFYLDHPLYIPMIWRGGLAIHGALIGGGLALYLYCRQRKISFLSLGASIVPGLALAQAFGRWGNYFNQELYGRPSDLPWSIPISPYFRVEGYEKYSYFHPTFLYESLGNLIIFSIVLYFSRPTKKKDSLFVVSLYFGLYSLLRFATELLRIDPSPTWLGLRAPQWASILIIFGITTLYYKKQHGQWPTLAKKSQ